MPLTTLIGLVFALVAALGVAIGLAWLPMRLLVSRMSIATFIQRQRERRHMQRTTPDRRR